MRILQLLALSVTKAVSPEILAPVVRLLSLMSRSVRLVRFSRPVRFVMPLLETSSSVRVDSLMLPP